MIHNSTVLYHDIFGYPLTKEELVRWRCNTNIKSTTSIISKKGYHFLNGRGNLIKQRLQNEKTSVRKLEIAKKATSILSKIPTVKMVGITGSLAMMNSSHKSDIDLMVITKKGTLWMTRLVSLILLINKIRRFGVKNQTDKLCLNIWLDESDMIWLKEDRNIYTSHEIAQIVPLVNKDKIYEKFLKSNKWILDFWPNSVQIQNLKLKTKNYNPKLKTIEKIAFRIQYRHMKSKITRETVTKTRALFHPNDWGKVVLDRIKTFS